MTTTQTAPNRAALFPHRFAIVLKAIRFIADPDALLDEWVAVMRDIGICRNSLEDEIEAMQFSGDFQASAYGSLLRGDTAGIVHILEQEIVNAAIKRAENHL